MPTRARPDSGTGSFGTTLAFVVVITFLLFTTQLLFGLYARTLVSAVATDVAQRAAHEGFEALHDDRVAIHESEVRRRLGEYGERAVIEISLEDLDGDGTGDSVSVAVVADLPTLLPTALAPASPTRFTRTASARLETFQEEP